MPLLSYFLRSTAQKYSMFGRLCGGVPVVYTELELQRNLWLPKSQSIFQNTNEECQNVFHHPGISTNARVSEYKANKHKVEWMFHKIRSIYSYGEWLNCARRHCVNKMAGSTNVVPFILSPFRHYVKAEWRVMRLSHERRAKFEIWNYRHFVSLLHDVDRAPLFWKKTAFKEKSKEKNFSDGEFPLHLYHLPALAET